VSKSSTPLPYPPQALTFELAIGRCTLRWTPQGLYELRLDALPTPEVALPCQPCLPCAEGTQAQEPARPTQQPSSNEPQGPVPPSWEHTLVERLRGVLGGSGDRLLDIPLDLSGVPPFHRLVYQALREVAPGTTITYQELGRRAGSAHAARAVGQAMRSNRHLLVVPCHRVLSAGHRLGGFSAPGGTATKQRLLQLEGATAPLAAIPEPADPPAATSPTRLDASTSSPSQGARSLWEPGVIQHASAWLARCDPQLALLMEAMGPCGLRPPQHKTAFGALCEAVIYQQLAGSAARAITRRFCALVGGSSEESLPSPRQVLDASASTLAEVGLSGSKQTTLLTVAEAVCEGQLQLEELATLDAASITQVLTRIRGIGPWTADMMAIFFWGRPDVLPSRDLGIRKALAQLLGHTQLPTPREVEELGRRWQPFRTVVSWYLWKSLGGVTLG
jgi:O-6-methylguanine DNA methyltransferase